MLIDDLYDYSTFPTKRVHDIFTGWDGLGGYHGLLMKKCADLMVGNRLLDVGCGLCHLYEALKEKGKETLKLPHYIGIEPHNYIHSLAKKRYPHLQIYKLSMHDLYGTNIKGLAGGFDTVFAIGVYRHEPVDYGGLLHLVIQAKRAVVLTYFAKEPGVIPKIIRKLKMKRVEIIEHDIDPRLEIVRLWC